MNTNDLINEMFEAKATDLESSILMYAGTKSETLVRRREMLERRLVEINLHWDAWCDAKTYTPSGSV
jgi:hypothetical protein